MSHIRQVTRAQATRAAHARTAVTTGGGQVAAGNRSVRTQYVASPRKATSQMTVRERFETLEERFLPAKAAGVNVRFHFKISGAGGGEWYVEIKGGKITVKPGSGPNITASLKANAEDYLKIANGEMNKVFAVIRGKLDVGGDKDALKQFDNYFSGNSAKG